MRKLLAVFAILGFVAALGAGSLYADDFLTGCVKEKGDGSPKKNTKLKRVAIGEDPGSGCGGKEVEVTLVTDQLADSLQSQINTNAANIDTNTTNIANNTAAIGDNAAMIDNIKGGLISSMIGGGHNSGTDGDAIFYMPLYNWFRLNTNEEAASKVAVTGWLTDLVVVTNEPVGADARLTFSYVINGDVVNVDPIGPCETMGDNTMCQSTGCANIEKGDMLSVRVVAEDLDSTPNVSPTRWTGRFVETDELCPVLEP